MEVAVALIAGLVALVAAAVGWQQAKRGRESRERIAQEQIRHSYEKYGEAQAAAIDQFVTVGQAVEVETAQPTTAEAEKVFRNDLRSASETQGEEIAEAFTTAAKKPWHESWGPIIVASIAAVAAITAAVLTFVRTDPADCAAYSNSLLSIHERAPDNASAVETATAFEWGDFDDQCGSPEGFLVPLGDYTPPVGP